MSVTSPDQVATLLRQLTGVMKPVQHLEGTQADAAHTSVDRVVWIPNDLGIEPAPYRRRGKEVVARWIWDFDVSIYGGSRARVLQLFCDTIGWLDLLIGPPQGAPDAGDGYMVKPSTVEPRGGTTAAEGWGMVARIVLKGLVVRRTLKSIPVQKVDLTIEITDPNGTGSTTIIAPAEGP